MCTPGENEETSEVEDLNMPIPRLPNPANSRWLFAASVVTLLLLLPACSVNVKKEANGEDKQVDIKTLVGGFHVSKQADASDVGLAIYPGARLNLKDSDGDGEPGNVNIPDFGLGVKVA